MTKKKQEDKTESKEKNENIESYEEHEVEVLPDVESKQEEKVGGLDELTEKYIRLVAEYDNYRKRTQREKEAIYSNSIVTVVTAWLPIIDDMERGLDSAKAFEGKEVENIAEGMEMVLKNARETMSTMGVEEIKAKGQQFDPNTMEAVMHCKNEDAGENEVIEVIKKGYIRGEKVIRHAVVVVAN